MIDPITAISAATASYNMVKKLVYAGRELEDIAGQLGKWYGAAADLGRAEQQRKNPPIFTKLFSSGSVEQEALQIIIHQKKLAEQEKDLQQMLNNRFGYGTWREMVELRRKIKKSAKKRYTGSKSAKPHSLKPYCLFYCWLCWRQLLALALG